jgi:DNA-binding GntR family transcriptional regulator
MNLKLISIERTTMKDQVYHLLRFQILKQYLVPGERLNVDDIAKQLGVSHTPVKDALNRLSVEGLITIKSRSGTYVTELDPEDLLETYDVRLALEVAAAERLVHAIDEKGLHRLAELIGKVDVSEDGPLSIEEHLSRNFDFHGLFVELSGNKKLYDVYTSLNASIQVSRIHYCTGSNWLNRLEQEREEHLDILNALRDRDEKALVEAIRAHLNRAKGSLLEDIQASLFKSNGHSHRSE